MHTKHAATWAARRRGNNLQHARCPIAPAGVTGAATGAAWAAVAALGAAAGLAAAGSRVLVIGVDGLRPDCIAGADTPALDALIADGSFNTDAQCEDLTFSGPNWASILNGVHRDKHRVINNEYRPSRVAEWPDFLTLLERTTPALVTAKCVSWDPIGIKQPSECDVTEIPEGDDEPVTLMAVQMLTNQHPQMPQGPDVLFVHLDEVDGAGHTHGFHPSSPNYLRGIEEADARIGRIVQAMRQRANFDAENWLVVLTSDHGGAIDKNHGGNTPEKRAIPFLVSGKAAAKGSAFPNPRSIDVAATVLTHMGVPIDPAWQLDSRPIGLTATAAPAARLGQNLIYNGDAEAQRGFDVPGIDAYALGWNDPGPSQFTILRSGGEGALPNPNPNPNPDPNRADPAGGANHFAGGMSRAMSMTQRIDLAAIKPAIEAGARYELSAWLGAKAGEVSPITFEVRFVDSGDNDIPGGTTFVHAPSGGAAAGFVRYAEAASVPKEAAAAVVELSALRLAGVFAEVYADNLSLVISAESEGAAGSAAPAGR